MASKMIMKMCCCAWMVAAWWGAAAASDCGSPNYVEEVVVSGFGMASGLAVDYNTSTMYFSFHNGSWHSAKVDLRSQAFTLIEDLRGLCKFTVDQVRGYVYAGCSTDDDAPGGLYQWEGNTARFELAGELGQDIEFVYYDGDKLYYSSRPKFLLRTFHDGRSVPQAAPSWEVWDLVADARGDWIFTNDTGVYRRHQVAEGTEESRYEGFHTWVYKVVADRGGAAYTCHNITPRGIWRLNEGFSSTRLLDVRCRSMTFDADGNIIYVDYDRDVIIRLLPHECP